MKINGFDVDKYKAFAFDGCHKIYLLKTKKEIGEFKKMEYDIYKMDSGIIQCYLDSCPLRFIETNGGKDCSKYLQVVPQGCEKVEFEGFDTSNIETDTSYDLVARNEDGKFIVEYVE